MTARVRGVMTAAMVSAVMFCESRSMSANTGVAPARTMHDTEARKVREVTMTSSPGPMSSAIRAASSAWVPLPSATAWAQPAQAAHSVSNSRQYWLVQEYTLLETNSLPTSLTYS